MVPSWTKYSSAQEWATRLEIIKDGLDRDADSRQVPGESGNVLHTMAVSWAYVLEDIPTRYLDECVTRALRRKANDFPLAAAAVNREYDDMLPEIQDRARREAAQYEYLQLAAGPSLPPMGLDNFRARHNLPPTWRPGDPYPDCSDLASRRQQAAPRSGQ